MNLLAHAFVALSTGDDDPEFVLGAVLPDLTSMAGVRLDRSQLAAPVERGVDCHHRTDAAFHGLPVFMQGSSRISRTLRRDGVRAGAARAIGHVGWELLLDGTLIATPAAQAYRHALDRAEDVAGALTPMQRWAWFLGFRDRLGRPRYDEPAWVAERLQHMLEHRPLLAFPATQLPLVTTVLEEAAVGIAAAADDVLGTVAGMIATGSAPPNRQAATGEDLGDTGMPAPAPRPARLTGR